MRINEAYEHEPLLACQSDYLNSCGRIGTQCVDIEAAMTLTPTADMGTVTVSCQGTPNITCETNGNGTSCTVTMTQQICVSVPINYGVELTAETPRIACADNHCIGCGSC